MNEDLRITIAFDDGQRKYVEAMLQAFPKQARAACRVAISEAARSTKAYGLRLSRKEYAIAPASRKRIDAQCRISIGEGEALVSFTGGMGAPLRWFQARPARGRQDWKGQKPAQRRPREGVSVRRRTAGQRHPAYGPRGEKSFWMKGASGNVILVYRPLGTQEISTQGLMGPSPIQAIRKAENAERIRGHAGEVLEKRTVHALERLVNSR